MRPFLPLLLAGLPAVTVFAVPLTVGPDYHRPDTAAPAAFRDTTADAGAWKIATPADRIARGAWWEIFGDTALDDLETRALAANEDLHAAAARVEQARAAAGLARSAYWPQLAAGASLLREQTSTTVDNVAPAPLATTYGTPLGASWELDLFGRVRRQSEGARAEAVSSAADFENVRLALTAEVASSYFGLRTLDRETVLVADGVDLRSRALKLVTARRAAGAATDFDVARAEAELAATEVEAADLARRRAGGQNALAVLLGSAAPEFQLPPATTALASQPPTVPAGLPGDLLERRPDVAAAEAALAAANARIGVAKAAFFPSITLTGSAGYASGDIDRLFQADSRIWSVGPGVYLPIFQGGRNRANLQRSRAAYEESVALFRQRVLVALGEVQDALTATQLLATQAAAQERTVVAARRAGQLAQTRFEAGFVNYLEVIDAQRTVLSAERATAQLTAQRLLTSVALIKALGGGWVRPLSIDSLIAAR